ncbi:5-oxoprolinase subunit B family protein [Dactylosporangium sp. CA-233914]|uniref:5-oxoprolinase subunit B family protein n=1 Tax=Dactylosporangium sp. CA-233914 TaxID=3239934 RepID=UPI003D8B66CA
MSTRESGLHVQPYGDSALLVRCLDGTAERTWTTLQLLSVRMRAAALNGVESVVATFDTMLVEFDPLRTDVPGLQRWLYEHVPEGDLRVGAGRVFRIPVAYGGDFGPDLPAVADELGLSVGEVVEMHSSTRWRVAFNGAPAGAPLHDGSPFGQAIRRMPQPRVRISAGTVALAGHQGTIYTVVAPGGWRLIGRTPLRIVDKSVAGFVAVQPGDTLLFAPVSDREFAAIKPRFIGEPS